MKNNAAFLVFILFVTFQYSFALNVCRTASNATLRLLSICKNEKYDEGNEQKTLEIPVGQFTTGLYTLALENDT